MARLENLGAASGRGDRKYFRRRSTLARTARRLPWCRLMPAGAVPVQAESLADAWRLELATDGALATQS